MPAEEYSRRHYVAANGKATIRGVAVRLAGQKRRGTNPDSPGAVTTRQFRRRSIRGKGAIRTAYRYWSRIPSLLHGGGSSRCAVFRSGRSDSTKGHSPRPRMSCGLQEEARCLELHPMTIF